MAREDRGRQGRAKKDKHRQGRDRVADQKARAKLGDREPQMARLLGSREAKLGPKVAKGLQPLKAHQTMTVKTDQTVKRGAAKAHLAPEASPIGTECGKVTKKGFWSATPAPPRKHG